MAAASRGPGDTEPSVRISWSTAIGLVASVRLAEMRTSSSSGDSHIEAKKLTWMPPPATVTSGGGSAMGSVAMTWISRGVETRARTSSAPLAPVRSSSSQIDSRRTRRMTASGVRPEVVVVPRRRVAGGVGNDDPILQGTVRELAVGKAHVEDARAGADRQPAAAFGDVPRGPVRVECRDTRLIGGSVEWGQSPGSRLDVAGTVDLRDAAERTALAGKETRTVGAPDDVWASTGDLALGISVTSPVMGSITAGRPPLRESANRSVGPQRPPSVMPLTRRGGRSAESRSTNTQPNSPGDCAPRASHPVDEPTRMG